MSMQQEPVQARCEMIIRGDGVIRVSLAGEVDLDVSSVVEPGWTAGRSICRRSPSSEPVSGAVASARLRSEIVSTTRSCLVRQRR